MDESEEGNWLILTAEVMNNTKYDDINEVMKVFIDVIYRKYNGSLGTPLVQSISYHLKENHWTCGTFDDRQPIYSKDKEMEIRIKTLGVIAPITARDICVELTNLKDYFNSLTYKLTLTEDFDLT